MKDLRKPTLLYYHWQLTKTTNLEVIILAYTIKSISRFSKLIYLHYYQSNILSIVCSPNQFGNLVVLEYCAFNSIKNYSSIFSVHNR